MSDNTFFAYISRLKNLTRWNSMRCNSKENVAEHSFTSATIAHTLGLISNKYFNGNVNPEELAVCALLSNSYQAITGDMPSPLKRNNPTVKEAYASMEEDAKNKLLDGLPEDFREDYEPLLFLEQDDYETKLVNASNLLSSYVKCVEECSSGNADFEGALTNILEKLNNTGLPEVEYFLRLFDDGLGKSLDELE